MVDPVNNDASILRDQGNPILANILTPRKRDSQLSRLRMHAIECYHYRDLVFPLCNRQSSICGYLGCTSLSQNRDDFTH